MSDFRLPKDFQAPVVVYGTPICGFCRMAKRLLTQREIPFAWVDVSGDAKARAWLEEASGQRTVPQVFIRHRSVGGYSELSALDASGELENRLVADEKDL